MMGRPLPLFPLGSVLFPGLVMPLQVFEARYRALVRDLMALPDGTPREFGVVAIQRGWEVENGMAAALSLHEIGCTAQVRQVTEHDDGRFDLVTVGRQRFRIAGIDRESAPYLLADVEFLPEREGPVEAAERLAPRVLAAFRRYLALIRPAPLSIDEQLPEEPTLLSHLVAATAHLTLDDRQRLLAEPDTAARLRAELTMLTREEALLREIRAVPAKLTDLAEPISPN
jgi:Lon protease-like protein